MQKLNFVSMLLLLSILLSALATTLFVATAHRELPMSRNGEEGHHDNANEPDREVGDGGSGSKPGGMAAKVGKTRCGFRTRKLPTDGNKIHFDGLTAFTSDYTKVKRHPPKHN